jgi:hypothetical protein
MMTWSILKKMTLNVGVGKEKSRKYILISSSSTLTTEFRTYLQMRLKENSSFRNVRET